MKIKLDPGAICPTRAYETDAGLDLYSREDVVIPGWGNHVFATGVHVQLPPQTKGNLECKSGLYIKHNIVCFGTIDQGYTGEIFANLVNLSPTPYRIKAKDKITQLVVTPIRCESVEIVPEIEGGPRGDKGLGSTGR